MNMMSLVLSGIVGGALGAALGYFGQCTSGTCPLTSTWWRGAIYGAVMGLVFFAASGRGSSAKLNEPSKNVVKIGEKDFDREVMMSPRPVLVDFFAPWCGPCQRLAPVLDQLAGEFSGQIKFAKINVDEASALAARFAVEGVPTLMLFKDGKVVDTIVGVLPAETLKARLEAAAHVKDPARLESVVGP